MRKLIRKCHSCGKNFTPDWSRDNGAFYCPKCCGVKEEKHEESRSDKYTIKEAREKVNMSQSRVAQELHLSIPVYHRYERENKIPTVHYKGLSRVLKMPLSKLKLVPNEVRGKKHNMSSKNISTSKPPKNNNAESTESNNMNDVKVTRVVPKGHIDSPESKKLSDKIDAMLSAADELGCECKLKYPQDSEKNEYRYIDPKWLNEIAYGLTAGADKHPNESWKDIPADEHLARAMRHINLARLGDKADDHLINASMRIMMAYVISKEDEKCLSI